MNILLPQSVLALRERMVQVAERDVAPHSRMVDERGEWPSHAFAALRRAGLMGLHVPKELGGLGEGLHALAVCTEALGHACASSAICYGMHCVGTAVIAAKATKYHADKYLRPIAAGEHITTLSLSESGSGSQFYIPSTTCTSDGENYVIEGEKHFVTNGGRCDSYVVSTCTAGGRGDTGDFSCLLVDKDTPGLEWGSAWDGFGMRGNSARSMRLKSIRIPKTQLLGHEGDQMWYIFEVVAPYFLVAMAGTYLGVAQAALDEAVSHVKTRIHSHSGDSLATLPPIQSQIAEMWSRVERTRLWLYQAAQMGDLGHPNAVQMLLGSKLEASETAVWVANEAMTVCGGIAYRENSDLSRYLRDARASHVMSPTSALLRLWIGRSVLGQPLL
jgi:isovaleryl-CoA dehydrogenase